MIVDFPAKPLARLVRSLRLRALCRKTGWKIATDAFIASTARLQTSSGGQYAGGMLRIGSRASICDGVILAPYGGEIALSDNVYIGPYCVLYGHGGLRIGAHTLIGAHSVIIPAEHTFDDPALPIACQPQTASGISIGRDVWIGCGVRILDGVRIGDGCIIGAGAVVTTSTEPGSIAVGVPARVIRSRNRACNPDRISRSTSSEKS